MRDAVRSRVVHVLSYLLFFSCVLSAWAQPAHLVKDLNTTRSRGIDSDLSLFPQNSIVALGRTVFFSASDEIHGSELWRSDGTKAGTRLVADLCSGSCASTPRNLTAVGGLVFFTADDGLHGRELWKSDGTAAGTVLVKDLIPEDKFGRIDGLTELNGFLLFGLAPTGYLRELWRSDGTAAGPVRSQGCPASPSSPWAVWSSSRASKGRTSVASGGATAPSRVPPASAGSCPSIGSWTAPPPSATACSSSPGRLPKPERSCGAATAPRREPTCSRRPFRDRIQNGWVHSPWRARPCSSPPAATRSGRAG